MPCNVMWSLSGLEVVDKVENFGADGGDGSHARATVVIVSASVSNTEHAWVIVSHH
jgi:hypothetical protein